MTPPANAARGIDLVRTSDVAVIGTGVAGLSVALSAGGLDVALITKTRFGFGGASPMAQGGVAAAVVPGDSSADHAADTLAAAAGLADPGIVRVLTDEGPGRIAELLAMGTGFDRHEDGRLSFGREAAHGRARILHARDATGAEIVRAMAAATHASRAAKIYEGTFAVDLVVERGRVVGLLALDESGARVLHLARAVVLASGGIGRVFAHTTNPVEATGDGLAMAARAGAELADVEFVQFHPTALAAGCDPMPLLTEALRGRGAVLVDGDGRRFMPAVHPDAELAPRDVVARAIWKLGSGGTPVYLDAREAVGERLPDEFPTAFSSCQASGIDPRREPMPVSPAAHYHMGGVAVDALGRSSLPGLWACGEVSRTGAHGANRLASNSLLEGLVFGSRVGRDLARVIDELPAAKVLVGADPLAAVADREEADEATEETVRRKMWNHVGLERNAEGLSGALADFEKLAEGGGPRTPAVRNLLCAARLVTTAALARRESRGAHYRSDFPEADEAWRQPLRLAMQGTGGPYARIRIARQPGESTAPGGAAAGRRGDR